MFLDASVSYFSFLLCCHNSDFLNACPQNETWYFKLVMTLSSPFHIVKFLMQLQISSETCSRQRNQRSSFQHPLDHRKSKRVPEKHLLLLYWLHQNLWLCGSNKNCGKFIKKWEYQTTLPASWEICMQVKKQQLELDMEQQTGPKLERSMSRLYIVTLFI